ncbi:distal tail protein Dit [Streptococcus agalactiae]
MAKVFKKMTADGIDLSHYFQIKKIHRPATADITNNVKQYGKRGAQLIEKKYGSKLIKVDIFIKEDILATIDILNSIFIREEFKIVFSDRPDKYFIVTLTDISDPSSDVRNADLTLSFLALDGQEHSTSYQEATSFTEYDDKIVFHLQNNGNKEAFPIITLNHTEENGYIGLVNRLSVFQLGDEEEVDTEPRQHSVVTYNYKEKATQDINQALAIATPNAGRFNDAMQTLDGTLSVKKLWNRSHIYLSSYPATAGINHAGSITFDIPDGGSLNDYIWWRQIFWCLNINQLGFIKISVSDENGDFLYGVETIKRKKGLETEYNFLVTDENGGYKNTPLRWKFKATEYNNHNPFNAPRGWSDLTRSDDQVSVHWWGSQYKRTFPELKGRVGTKIHIGIGAFDKRPFMSYALLNEFMYRKDKVTYDFDIPNAFGQGCEVVIDSERDIVTVDNVKNLNIVADGFDSFPVIPVGPSDFEIHFSSWNTKKPIVKLTYEERW